MTIDETHDPAAVSWVPSAAGHPDFPVQNLPFGVFEDEEGEPRVGVAIGEEVLDLTEIDDLPHADYVRVGFLDAFFTLTPAERTEVRRHVFRLLTDERHRSSVRLVPRSGLVMGLPATVGDYTDFYVGIHHATNVGRLFRPDQPLMPNYKHVPIGYHGRASSVRPSGEAVRRPSGQAKAPDADAPTFGPSRRLDYELELGIWVGRGNELGVPIDVAEAADHVAGYCLLNDWSARDLQAWEYQPLGPFLGKSFHTTVSPWVVTPEALAPFRAPQPPRPAADPRPLPYLWSEADQAHGAFAIELGVGLRSARMREAGMAPHVVARSSSRHMYWTVAQLIAHHTSNGCNLEPGDLLGTGTLSGPDADSLGSLLESTQGGRVPITLPTGETRTFLEDGDEVTLTGNARAPGFVPIGFGPCTGVVRGAGA